jgi:TPP-dependent pyruvate/acetoin dehydrogenase alpha subunit
MMATGPEVEAYENPLIPNAKLRQIYVAMVRARLLGKALAKRRRGEGALGLEACLVSTSVDLGQDDFVSDAVMDGTVDFLRGAMFRSALGGTVQTLRDTTLESVLRPDDKARRRGLKADCGAPSRLPAMPGNEARFWAAMGIALALKAQHAHGRAESSADAARQGGVVVVYARLGEGSPALWRKVLAFAAEHLLPVLFVVLPATQRPGAHAKATRSGAMSAVSHRHGVPGMAVDADDAVALYRVAQEAIARARIGGGAALMECVPFLLEDTKRLPQTTADAIEELERYMLGRVVATRRWMEREAESCARRIAK